jgi:hypothetical protein
MDKPPEQKPQPTELTMIGPDNKPVVLALDYTTPDDSLERCYSSRPPPAE